MALQDYVSERRLARFKSNLDTNGYKNVIEKIKLNGTSQSVNQTDKSVNLFFPTWDLYQAASSAGYAKTVALKLKTEDGQGTRKAMALSIDSAADPQKVMVGVWGNLDTEMYNAEVPTIAAMNEAIEEGGGKINKIKVNGTEQTITNKEVDLNVPTMNGGAGDFVAWNGKTDPSERVNVMLVMSNDYYVDVETRMPDGNGTATETLTHRLVNKNYVDRTFRTEAQVAQQIAEAQAGAFVKVDSYDDLPNEGAPGKIYLVPNSGSGQNVYDEYIWCIVAMMPGGGGGESPVYGYEKIGTTVLDLTGYVREEDLVEVTEAQIDAMFT